MLIAIASPFRTGSTRLYNIVRIIVEQNYPEKDINYLWLNNNPSAKINITKVHDDYKWEHLKFNFIFTAKRDIRYTMASCLEYFSIVDPKTEKNIEWFDTICNQVIKQYNDWKDRSNLEVVYEKWESEKYYYICKIAEVLDMLVDPIAASNRLDNLLKEVSYENGNLPTDRRYLDATFHRSKKTHLDWKKRLPKEFIKHLKDNFSDQFYA
jgi:hypothetical protein